MIRKLITTENETCFWERLEDCWEVITVIFGRGGCADQTLSPQLMLQNVNRTAGRYYLPPAGGHTVPTLELDSTFDWSTIKEVIVSATLLQDSCPFDWGGDTSDSD